MRLSLPLLLAFCALAMLPSCATAPSTPAPSSQSGQSADSARTQERQQLNERDSQSVATVQAWMSRIPQMTPEAWRSEFALFLARYRDVSPKPEHIAASTERVSAWADGRTDEAKQQTSAALVDAQQFVDQLATERAARIAAEAKEAQSRAAAEKRIRELEEENRKLEDSIWRRVKFWITFGLYVGAVGCLLLAVLRIKAAMATGLNVLTAAKTAATWTGFAATLFSLSRIISAWWFWYACAGVVALVLAYVAYLVWREQKGEAAKRTLAPVVKVLDRIYDTQVGAAKDDMDATIFAPLSEEMKAIPGAKAFIHETRATMPASAK